MLCNSEVPSNKRGIRSWMVVTKTWLKTHGFLETEGGDKEDSTFNSVLNAEWWAAERCNRAHASAEYLKGGYESLSSMAVFPPLGRREQVRLGSGLRLLSLCRIGGLWTAPSLARAFKEQQPELEIYEELCPCCGAAVIGRGEDIPHILVECERWKEQRELYLGRFIRRGIQYNVGSEELGVFLLGGTFGRPRGMVWDWLPRRKGYDGHSKPSQEEILHCGALEVARFLESIECERRTIVGDLSSRLSLLCGAEALLGMAAV